MIIIERNKIAAVWLLIVLAIGFSYGSGGEILWERQKASATLTISNSPRVGEVFTMTYTFTSHVEPESADIFFYPHIVEFSVYTHPRPNAYKVIKGKIENSLPRLGKEESAEFSISLMITEPVPMIQISAYVPGHMAWGPTCLYYLIDNKTGQYGTKEEYEGKLPVEYRYDPFAGTFTCSPSQNPAPVEENLKIIKMIKQLEPALSDSEALLLHAEEYLAGVPKDVAQWDEKNRRWTEEKVYEYYLKDGWYKALKDKTLDQWRLKEKKKIEDTWKESRLNFFRPGTDSINSSSHRPDSVTKTFDGYWKFKDHIYNKDQGLLAQAIKKPIYQGRARVLSAYVSGGQPRKLSNQCVTNSSGYFIVSTVIPTNATLCKAFAIIYPCGGGSDTAAPMISVSDPNNTAPSWDKDPLDPTLYVIKNMFYEQFDTSSSPVHFDTVYTDTFPEVIQPNSGCINIYETYLQARTFTSPPPISPLRVMWEPGYLAADTTSGYKWNRDTIVICGYVANTDEWDDDVLLHEYGHFLMDYYAQLPPSGNIIYNWHQSLPSPSLRNLIYTEAWAYFFSSRARVGTEFDSLFVNTRGLIGSGQNPLWRNLENPWLGSEFDTLQFVGGPWCVGSVTGILWDIYDSKNESPYHSYPWPGFPDINLRDTLSLGINPIWDVFDHYDPPEKASNCWTIFHFRSGWNIYGYDHSFGFDQIFLHHRIRDTIPAKPTGLTASIENNNVRLYWHKNTELDLKGYRVYRRSIFPVVPRDWSIIAEKNSPTDTTHLDVTVRSSWTYQYKVTAFDSLGNESPFSDSVEIAIPLYPLNTDGATIITLPTIVDAKELEINLNNSCHDIVLEIYDCLGRIVNKQTVKLNNNNSLAIDLEDKNHTQLSTGVYFLRLGTDKNEVIIKKFVIIK